MATYTSDAHPPCSLVVFAFGSPFFPRWIAIARRGHHHGGMKSNRRRFLKTTLSAGLLAAATRVGRAGESKLIPVVELDRVLSEPVLKLDFVKSPVNVESLELLRNGKAYLLRARSSEGVEAITVPNPTRMAETYPIFLKHIAPVFLKRTRGNSKRCYGMSIAIIVITSYKGLALWVGVAAVEMALLELMGQTVRRPVADFFGGVLKRDIPVYYASGNRGNRPEEEIEYLRKLVAGSGVKAIKFRLGGRMNRNADSLPGRTEALIPLVRKTFGDDFTLYADSNSSYDAREAIRIGRLLEEHRYGFYEEPCPFDACGDKGGSRRAHDPGRPGEQEFSLHRWKWSIASASHGYRAARLALRRRLHSRHAGGSDGGRGRDDGGPSYVGGRARPPGRGPLRLVYAERGPLHGVQGEYRPARDLRNGVVEVRKRRRPLPDRTRLRREH